MIRPRLFTECPMRVLDTGWSGAEARLDVRSQIDGRTDFRHGFPFIGLWKKLDLDEFCLVAAHDEVVISKANLHGPTEGCRAHDLAFRPRDEPKIYKPFAYLSAERNAHNHEFLSGTKFRKQHLVFSSFFCLTFRTQAQQFQYVSARLESILGKDFLLFLFDKRTQEFDDLTAADAEQMIVVSVIG